nr:probable plastid-lipid-associated protein 8, chloroplastic [Ipomoea batatas]
MASISLLTTTAPPLFLPIPSPSASPIRISHSHSLPLHHHKKLRTRLTLRASAVSAPSLSKPDDLVNALLSKVVQTDRGVLLTTEEHGKVAEMASDLESFCVDEPVKCPLIFGEWDVVYCSNPTSPGGVYRSAIGRLFFKTKEMIQILEAPDTVRNKVSFSLFGFLDGEVSLKGTLIMGQNYYSLYCLLARFGFIFFFLTFYHFFHVPRNVIPSIFNCLA